MPVIPAFRRLRQEDLREEDQESEANLYSETQSQNKTNYFSLLQIGLKKKLSSMLLYFLN
jgi:hypothetical protein